MSHCTCIGTYTPSSPCTSSSTCFRLGNILVAECDSNLLPCGGVATVNFDCFKMPCVAPNYLEFKVTSNSRPDLIRVVNITSSEITLATTVDAKGGEFVTIEFYGQCTGLNCDTLSDYGSVTIYIKNVCRDILCESYQVCDPCTKLCVDVPPEISVDPGPQEIFIQS
jgi:23S rRNA U2552 (ribose-2'-O)-methylase RlmE/FtsJ